MKIPQNLAANIARNALFGILAKGTQIGTRLVTIPVVISHLGLDGYGIWNVIMVIAAYMRFGSVGVKSAFQKYVAEATGNGDYESANRLLSTGCALMLALSAALIPIAIFSRRLAVATGVPPQFLGATANAISVLALIMTISNVGSVFEAIVMGGHRLDISRRVSTVLTILEAGFIVWLLHLGYGLFAMASVMAASEVGFVACCAIAARRVMPEVKISRKYVTRRVVPELLRFAGSYQMVSVLEVMCAAILPVAVLRTFGAEVSGIYALGVRLTTSAQVSDSFLTPILSGSAMVFASGSKEALRTLILKSFKVVLCLSLFPLGFISIFGPSLVFVWTGQSNPLLHNALWLISTGAFCQSLSVLGLVLYRASGRAALDNVRQVFRIVALLATAALAHQLGFVGMLAGVALAELLGMVLMLFAVVNTFRLLLVRALASDAARLVSATAIVLALGFLGLRVSPPVLYGARFTTAVQLTVVALISVSCLWPALRLTRAITPLESRVAWDILLARKTA